MSFWENRQVLVTGGHGFLGKHLVDKLRKLRAEVIAPTSQAYNLIDNSQVIKMFEENPCDMVIHLAGRVGGIEANRLHPAAFFYENLMSGVQTLHQAYEHGIPKFIGYGTVCSYPKYTPVPFKEEELWNGYPEETNAPYGIAKKMMLVQAQAYRQEYDYNAVHLLSVNLYGPGDNFNPENFHVVPALVKRCVDAQEAGDNEIVVWGDGTPTREFLYVKDAVEGLLLAAEKYNSSEPVNLGSSNEISIKDLVEIIAAETGFKGKLNWDTSKPNGQPRRKLDTSRAEKAFGFKSKTTFTQGLRETIEWYKQNRHSLNT